MPFQKELVERVGSETCLKSWALQSQFIYKNAAYKIYRIFIQNCPKDN